MMISKKRQTNPGIHPNFAHYRFGTEEQSIISKLKFEWYLTNEGSRISLANSVYDFFLMKPTRIFTEMFNLNREVICVFSPYDQFEPRTLDAFDAAQRRLSDLRVESVCRVLISKDLKIGEKIDSLLKTDPEQPIVVPFSYSELLSQFDDFFIRNRFRKHFYTRDLFSFLSPLKKDLYFFGRSELLQEIINKHRSGEHTGLFGLRKSGKTSIVYAIERHMVANDELFLSLDCESPSIHMLRWNELLKKIVVKYSEILQSKYSVKGGDRYCEKNAADSFSEDFINIHNSKKHRPILLLFDEIERISPCTGSSEHWRSSEDFVYFWQSLRGFFQRNQNMMTYMLVGTNPSCIELPTMSNHDNPLFASIPSQYVPSFSVKQVEDMVKELGHFMGLTFDDIIYGKLTDDFGGHPFLIRQICSAIHTESRGDRPLNVDKALYEKVKKNFQRTAIEYLEMIVQVLKEWYPDEYDMLCFLAQDDYETFKNFAQDNERYTKHLIGYGLIQSSENGYTFNIEMIREYLSKVHKHENINLTDDQKVAEISDRRNKIEKGLRLLSRNTLITQNGKKKAAERVLASLPQARRDKIKSQNIDELLSRDNSELFFMDIINLIIREWQSFENVFDLEKERVRYTLDDINKSGRPDAHAKYVTNDEFTQLRLHFKKIENILDDMGAI
jgi:hypothetical protein